ncbi:MAG: redoxin domain-containing protein [Nitrospinaceae bacterium]|nr:TlpA family protein disulfide reductase [Nitrospinaceae bacterium]NIR57653.1 TlpA family protein disulfide reductase [Nitrospinaceae bacterium]NIS88128.1 TlpA family protein disulfide reductase [Nitrospinaceae bacterium]NIT84995.1 TlpA family protein disulfide reductase [Nitrospinaceae bacterium]NIU47164.1 TlpA family protein disulfide reductase [Nitrospinaceae bacterium]
MIGINFKSPIAVRRNAGRRLSILLRKSGLWAGILVLWVVWPAVPSLGDEDPPAPNFSVVSLQGSDLALKNYRGRYLLVNFWATWCGPCKMEMPSLETLHQKFKHRRLTVIAISNDMFGAQVVEPFIKAQKLTFPIGLDPKSEVSNQYGVISLPTTFLIDPQGRIIGVLNGAKNWAEPGTLLYFDQLLGKTPNPPAAR